MRAMSSSKMGGARSRRRGVELQGPRPAPLAIREESREVGKPPRKPVVVYVVSPKVIHVEASEFMALVQRLTGLGSSPASVGGGSSGTEQGSSAGGERQLPVRVKARALNRYSGASGTAWLGHASSSPSQSSIVSPALFLQDWSPRWSAVGGEGGHGGFAASESWWLQGDSPDWSRGHGPSPGH